MRDMNKWTSGALLSVLAAMLLLLAACSTGTANSDGGSKTKAGEKIKLSWAVWGNPGELGRFQELTDAYNLNNPDYEWSLIPIPGEYEQKILTQLSGGTAPDVFYAGDGTIVKLIENGTIEELTPWLEQSDVVKADDFYEGLWGAAKKDDQIYGIAVDCNPAILWYNKDVLEQAGISEMPADLYEFGRWNWQAFQQMTDQISGNGKYGFVVSNAWWSYYSWVTSNGGNVFDSAGNYIVHEDPKAMEAFEYLYDNMQSGGFTFAGTLPKGQGADAMFMSDQVGFVSAGRWYLPIFKQSEGLSYDIVPYPTNTGNTLEPAGIATAYMVMNKNTKEKEETFKFLSEFVSKEGQIFRLAGGGNAVPSVVGADEVVGEGNLPEHASYFLDAREVGYALFVEEAGIPGLSGDLTSEFEALWLGDDDFRASMQRIGEMANDKIGEFKK